MYSILNKKIENLTVLEVLDFAELYNIFKLPTITLDDFCQITQKSKRRVYEVLKAKEIPENLIVDGYEYKRFRKSPIFHSKEVLAYINSKKVPAETHVNSRDIKIDADHLNKIFNPTKI